MRWEECTIAPVGADRDFSGSIESKILRKIGSRLSELSLDPSSEGVILRGCATSYHVKQLVQHEVMALISEPIRSNRIEVR